MSFLSGNPRRLIAALLTALAAGAAPADTPAPPRSYSVPAGKDGEFVFVMLPGRCEATQRQLAPGVEPATLVAAVAADPALAEPRHRACRRQTLDRARRRADSGRPGPVPLHAWSRQSERSRPQRARHPEPALDAYPLPGLYPNDGSTEPLWTVGWYAFSVDVSDDGRHLVRRGPWGGPLGVAFYDRGELLRAYDVKELVSDKEKLVYTVSHYFWVKEWEFLAHAGRLHVETLAGDRHVFDITTGALVDTRTYEPPRLAASVTMADGTRADLASVRLCERESPMQLVFGHAGADAPWKLIAMRREEPGAEGMASATMVQLDLADVARLDNENRVTALRNDVVSGHWFRLQARDGTVIPVALADGTALCGTDAAGATRQIPVDTLGFARLCREESGPGCDRP